MHGRTGNRVDRGWCRKPLELGDDRSLAVLRDHVTGVDTRIGREKRIQTAIAGPIQEPVGTPFGDARQVRDGDGKEVQHVAERCTMKVAIGLDTAVESDHWIINGRAQLDQRNPLSMINSVSYGASHLRRAA